MVTATTTNYGKPPCVSRPCNNCPMTKQSTRGWLGKKRITQILEADSFICHKTLDSTRLQCTGHMLIKKEANLFYRVALALGIDLNLRGEDKVFETEEECINHHALNLGEEL